MLQSRNPTILLLHRNLPALSRSAGLKGDWMRKKARANLRNQRFPLRSMQRQKGLAMTLRYLKIRYQMLKFPVRRLSTYRSTNMLLISSIFGIEYRFIGFWDTERALR